MDNDLKQKWVTALRSGDYRQGQGHLHADGEFCCLGVLCDVANVPWEWNEDIALYVVPDEDNFGTDDVLPDHLQNRFGLTEAQHEALWKMNDESGATFSEIADYIDKNIQGTDMRTLSPQLIDRARNFVIEKPSVSFLQRKLMIGYFDACELMEHFEAEGLVSPRRADGSRKLLLKDTP